MTSPQWQIRIDDLTGEATRDLLRLHLAGMHANSPPDHVNALDLSGLTAPGVTLWSAWAGTRIAGIGALKRHDSGRDGGTGELKSMRTHPDYLRQGIGLALLRHIICVARAEGLTRLSLETGSGPAFEPALALYRHHGFVNGDAFGGYQPSAFNQFLHLPL